MSSTSGDDFPKRERPYLRLITDMDGYRRLSSRQRELGSDAGVFIDLSDEDIPKYLDDKYAHSAADSRFEGSWMKQEYLRGYLRCWKNGLNGAPVAPFHLFHQFMTFETGKYAWSIEKIDMGLVLQRSTSFDEILHWRGAQKRCWFVDPVEFYKDTVYESKNAWDVLMRIYQSEELTKKWGPIENCQKFGEWFCHEFCGSSPIRIPGPAAPLYPLAPVAGLLNRVRSVFH